MTDGWSLTTPVARLVSQEEIEKASESELDRFISTVDRVKGELRTHFDTVAIPITNEKWRVRWRSMCVSQVGNVLDGLDREGTETMTDEEREKEEKAERWRSCPSFLREECNMVGLGELVLTLHNLSYSLNYIQMRLRV